LEEKKRCHAAGMNDHVSKPIDPDALFEAIGRHFRRPAATAGLLELPIVPGLDTADGLTRMAGNRALYLKLLRRFAGEHATTSARVAAQWRAGDRHAAGNSVHALRGVAGNLGAHALQAAAAQLEAGLQDSAPTVQLDALQLAFDSVLDAFVERVRFALGEPELAPAAAPASVAPASFEPAFLATILAQMHQHLAQSDAAASECLDAHRGLFAAVFPGEAFDLFETRVRDYAFAEAQAQLQQAAPEPAA
jgi:two-component system sensor histidine kinase/response regulator